MHYTKYYTKRNFPDKMQCHLAFLRHTLHSKNSQATQLITFAEVQKELIICVLLNT